MHEQVVQSFAACHVHTLVIDLDLFVRFEVIPNQHFLFATDQRGSDFHGRQPIDVYVSNNFVGKIQGEEGHVFVAVKMRLSGGRDSFRILLDQVVDDGEVVRSKVPNDVDIVLEEAKVDSCGIVVVELSQRAFLQKLFDFLNRPGKQEGMVDHNFQVFPRG